jgi:quercetin dioxygenase-like cupin family protein
MARIVLDGDKDHLVTPQHSDARGPVVRGQSIEVMKMHWRAGDSARPHQHPEEQAIYVLSGRLRMTVGDETYEIGPGEVSYHPSNVKHGALAVEDSVAISFKNIVAPGYPATKTLAG